MTDMTEARVIELIEAYGHEPAAWPESERDAAEALLRASPDVFADAIADARMLDAALSAMPEPSIPAGLAERIIASAPAPKRSVRAGPFEGLKDLFSIGGKMWPSATAMASAAFGVMIGYGAIGTAQVASVDTAEEAVYAAFDQGYDFTLGDFGQ